MKQLGRPISFDPKSAGTKTELQAMEDWGLEASLLIKRGMKARAWGYRELAEALKSQGVKRSAAIINRRVNRGNFSAGFLLACLYVLGEGIDSKASAKAAESPGEAANQMKKSEEAAFGENA